MPHYTTLPEESAGGGASPAVCCYPFLRSASHRGYRRLAANASAAVVRVEVGKERRVFHVDPSVLEAEPVRRLMAAAGGHRRGGGGAVVVEVDAILFEHLLWLAASNEQLDGGFDSAVDLREIVDFYSQDDEF